MQVLQETGDGFLNYKVHLPQSVSRTPHLVIRSTLLPSPFDPCFLSFVVKCPTFKSEILVFGI